MWLLHIFHNVPVKEFLKFTKSIENIDKVIDKSLVQNFLGTQKEPMVTIVLAG